MDDSSSLGARPRNDPGTTGSFFEDSVLLTFSHCLTLYGGLEVLDLGG